MKKIILIMLVSTFPFICFAQDYATTTEIHSWRHKGHFEEVVSDSIDGAIVTADLAKHYYRGLVWKAGKAVELKGDFFTPTKKEVLKAEEKLVGYLDKVRLSSEYWERNAPRSSELKWYKRFYVGIIIESQKKIFFNCYRSVEPGHSSGWQDMDVPVSSGGGNDYFWVFYDIKTETFSDLNIAGVVS